MNVEKNGLKCVVCGHPLKGKQRKYCSTKHQNEYLKQQRSINKKGHRYCVVCGKPLTTKQTKYCSHEHLVQNRVKRGYYRDRYRKERLKLGLVCHICGKVLPPYKSKYCSYKCAHISKNKLNTLMYEQDKILPYEAPIICEECKGRVLLMSDGEYVCKTCGLVY